MHLNCTQSGAAAFSRVQTELSRPTIAAAPSEPYPTQFSSSKPQIDISDLIISNKPFAVPSSTGIRPRKLVTIAFLVLLTYLINIHNCLWIETSVYSSIIKPYFLPLNSDISSLFIADPITFFINPEYLVRCNLVLARVLFFSMSSNISPRWSTANIKQWQVAPTAICNSAFFTSLLNSSVLWLVILVRLICC